MTTWPIFSRVEREAVGAQRPVDRIKRAGHASEAPPAQWRAAGSARVFALMAALAFIASATAAEDDRAVAQVQLRAACVEAAHGLGESALILEERSIKAHVRDDGTEYFWQAYILTADGTTARRHDGTTVPAWLHCVKLPAVEPGGAAADVAAEVIYRDARELFP